MKKEFANKHIYQRYKKLLNTLLKVKETNLCNGAMVANNCIFIFFKTVSWKLGSTFLTYRYI